MSDLVTKLAIDFVASKRDRVMQELVLQLLADSGQPWTVGDMISEIDYEGKSFNNDDVYEALSVLRDKGYVQNEGHGFTSLYGITSKGSRKAR